MSSSGRALHILRQHAGFRGSWLLGDVTDIGSVKNIGLQMASAAIANIVLIASGGWSGMKIPLFLIGDRQVHFQL